MDTSAFDLGYKSLTPAQKKAVDTVEGPVLVVAGPGTGKTHILTLRIANILLKTQANPTNILVLTFTDSAARTVRKRLASLVGEPVAREVFVSTFHGFAEYLISEYRDSFPDITDRRLMGDVEQTLLWRHVLETEEMELLRTPKSPYHYLRDLSSLQRDLVRERISLARYREWLEEERARLESDESLRYVRGEKAGTLKPDGVKKIERLQKGYEAARLIEAYEKAKEDRGVYDFSDVLRSAVDTLKEDETLCATLQEQYQYVLADEHQDANALQHALLDTLAFDEHPNLFVVGDEKQAIFRFQGADATHFTDFRERYPRAEVIALADSFRSYQEILDNAHAHAQRHMPIEGGHASLTASRVGNATIALLEAPDPLSERDQVASLVESAIKKGTEPHEIAVIASRNATANLVAEHLLARSIPTLRAGDIALESRPIVRSVLSLMDAVADPTNYGALREALLAPWWELSLEERARFLTTTRDRELPARLKEVFPAVSQKLATLQEEAGALPPLTVFSRLLSYSGARSYVLARAEYIEDDLPLLRKLYMHVEESVARDRNATFATIAGALREAREEGLSGVKTSVLQREGLVTVITAHKAKGMEFEKVFIVGLTKNEWEGGGKSPLIPSPVDMKRSFDDVARQFYVAMTRAKDEIVLSYAKESSEGKERTPSVLVPEDLPRIVPESDPLPLLHRTIDAPTLVKELVDRYLVEDGLTPTALKTYLTSPASFFACHVLRLREPDTRATAIGSSVHEGIAEYLKSRNEEAAYKALERTLLRCMLPRNRSFDDLEKDARARLASYIAHDSGVPTLAIEKSYEVRREVKGKPVLLKGKVDAVFEGPVIVDFKTTTDIKAHDEEYQHQLAFYDLLMKEEGIHAAEAKIVQVSEGEVNEYPIPLNDQTRAAFLALLEEVIVEMRSGVWRQGEESTYDAVLTLFS